MHPIDECSVIQFTKRFTQSVGLIELILEPMRNELDVVD
jgi:hypothetical protein